MTAHQKFEVVQRLDGFEVRDFAPCVVADVVVSGDVSSAGNRGFGSLFNYISQNQISMTAPVLEEELESRQWRISFVMPEGSDISTLPHPAGSPVVLRELPAHRAAVLGFNGRTTPKAILERELQLQKLLLSHALQAKGKARIARFDPPWKPPFARHNEVIIPIA